tara:strand:+ start:2223 stop:2807 length:585 start_codon:yes stop_codon:yes gene_type:complete
MTDIKDYIKITDNFLRPETVGSLVFWLSKQNFESACIEGTGGSGIVEKKVRDTAVFPLNVYDSKSKTKTHWYNYLGSKLTNALQDYKKSLAYNNELGVNGITDISALRYEEQGFYKFHTDHSPTMPRTLTCVILLNNDYEGGELEFCDTIERKSFLKVEPKVGRLIMWPSNFMFPHRVNFVSKNPRYSIIAWMF